MKQKQITYEGPLKNEFAYRDTRSLSFIDMIDPMPLQRGSKSVPKPRPNFFLVQPNKPNYLQRVQTERSIEEKEED